MRTETQSEYSSHQEGARHGGGQAVCRRAQARRAWELARTRFLVPFCRSDKKGRKNPKEIFGDISDGLRKRVFDTYHPDLYK